MNLSTDEAAPKRMSSAERAAKMLEGLNAPQRRAASHRDGPLVVFAGAGSGKTRIITHRIAWLIETGVPPWQILAVTFTNKAALEMRQRVDKLTPMGQRCLISTFHSACARWLREFATELGYSSDFTIYDDADSLSAIKTVLAEFNVKLDDQVSASDYKAAIAKVKTMAMLPSDERLAREWEGMMPPVGLAVYRRYQEYLAQCNAMDFADLIMNMLLLLRRNELVRETLQRRYRYVLVDEYQDTNRTQFELIQRLTDAHKNLFVVGDDDQSIYSWRGAMPSNIIEFDKQYPNVVKVTLEQNYRCSGNIVEAANAMIAHNKQRVAKRLFTENDDGERLQYRLEVDNEIEAWWVVDAIKAERDRFDLPDVAVFYRTNSQSRMMEDALRRENIPYKIYGTVRFYDRMEVKDLMAYFRTVMNPSDDVSVKRVVNVPARGIGDKAVTQVESEALERRLPLLKTIEALVAEGAPKISAKLRPFVALVAKLRAALIDGAVEDALETLLEATGYIEYVRAKFPEQAIDKIENIQELGAALADFAAAYPEASIAEWLQSVTLSSSEGDEGKGVSLMTLHMAKGLEYKRVFLVGVEEGLLPHRGSMDDPALVEEERRLLYVGMTRAKEKLSLTGAYRRRTYNTWAANRPSRFLTEIPPERFEVAATDVVATPAYASPIDDGVHYDFESANVEVGSAVSHPTYGRGVVEGVAHEFGVEKAVVRFEEFGLRKVACRHLTG